MIIIPTSSVGSIPLRALITELLSYPSTTSFTYTYNGDGAVTCSSSSTGIATCSVNTSTKTVTITPVISGNVEITLSASEGTYYYGVDEIVSVSISRATPTMTVSNTSLTTSYPSLI